jgi:hypothetical protein
MKSNTINVSNINKRRGTLIRLDQEESEDTKGVIRIRKSKNDRHYNGNKKRTKGQTTIYKTYI